MDWTSKRTVVTGAGGFIGSHLCEHLARAGADVVATVRYNSRGDDGNLHHADPALRAAIDVHRIDVTDIDAVRRVLKGADVVFNLAAYVGIPYSYESPQDTVINNVASTTNVLLVARDMGIGRLVQTSTSEVYGSAQQVPIPETHPLHPQSPYAASKVATDSIALSFHLSYGLPVVVLRPFNTFGPRQSARAVLPSVMVQALAGKEIKVGSTDTTRDFNYVDDTVRGFMLAASAPEAVGEVINIGSGREIKIDDAIQTIVAVAGRDNEIVHDDARVRPAASEVSRLWADITKARDLLGYEPQIAFEDGLRRMADWIGAHADLFAPETYAV